MTRRLILGTFAAVMASLAVPVGVLILAALPPASPDEGDAYIRGIIGVMLVLPFFAVLLVVYHGLVALVARAAPVRMPVTALGLSTVASLVIAALFLASGAPLSWDRVGDLLVVAGVVWVLLAVGSTAQYLVSFRGPLPEAAEPAAVGRPNA